MPKLKQEKSNSKLNQMNGQLFLSFDNLHGLTKLTHCHQSSPLKSSKALYLDDTNCATVYLVETSGGMVSGDTNEFRISLCKESEVTLIPQSSSKIYPANQHKPCMQSIDIEIEENAKLVWLPETTIPYKDSIFHSHTTIRMKPSSSLAYSEIFSSGREKSNESFLFHRFSSKAFIYVDEKLIIFDHLNLQGKNSSLFHLGMFESSTYLGTIWYINSKAKKESFAAIVNEFNTCQTHRVGLTNIDGYGLHFRWLSNDLCLIKEQMNTLLENL
ncbi:urease accessory protein UreD [Alkalihalobacillus sp. BA299]|uniref:urease accessory protein UreD n=1 Tax=Alkalihalobacillus sp. BA299 TaxID=2815938 RepID=UPI001ADCBA64|nr:urease accessory protein UreD [Alkalihalobacillus sp. BA299]